MDSTADRVSALQARSAELVAAAAAVRPPPSFLDALRRGGSVAVIAEIKRQSPSKGVLNADIEAGDRARVYGTAGAAAISVLTEPSRFGGAIGDLADACGAGVPLLRKDFIIDRLQLVEARAHGASAVLLIVRALPPERIGELYADAAALGLECLVEAHDADELDVAIAGGYRVIGVNNRNLETLAIDPGVGLELLRRIPPGLVGVYESGIESRADVERAAAAGADAVLVGTALSSSADPPAALRALTGVPRQARRAS
ncbi:MAG TPA: indole-3-glycerol-phosphate synthase [Gemmatimonadaceae bacterium]|nr:indole-3-glycerol-phosphate synthase [Gemmatimonadaceae bacterium]